MAHKSPHRAEGDQEDAVKLLYTDLSSNSVFGLEPPLVKLDHCDLLLDAMDAQLYRLQVQKHEVISIQYDCSDTEPLRWSQSLSKDTGFGSQKNDSPMSCLELMHTPTLEPTSAESTSGCRDVPGSLEETGFSRDRWSGDGEESESRREQVMWRLERLLGDACKEGGMAGETRPPSESVCTEDFARCFREEMVEPVVPEGLIQQQDREDETRGTKLSDSETFQSGNDIEQVVEGDERASEANSEDTVTANSFLFKKPRQNKQRKKCLTDGFVIGQRFESTPRLEDGNVSHRTKVVTDRENRKHNNSCPPKARCLAGVPVWSFDTVSIDSDLDTVCTEQVRQHIHQRPGWQSLIQSVTDMNDVCSTQSELDTPTQDESEPQSTSVQRSSPRHHQSLSVRKAQHSRRETFRHVFSLSDNDKDTDEENIHWSRTSRAGRSSRQMKERLSDLRNKCEEEEESLRLKRTQLRDAELCLSELQQKKKHALQELERLTVEMAQMEEQRNVLESVPRDRREEQESVCCELRKLQKQKEWSLLEVRDTQEDLAKLNHLKHTCNNRKNVPMSVVEREEMERQLDCAKTELFTEQRRAREKLESMQERLDETHEELHRASETQNSLRNRCTILEDEQIQKTEQIRALEGWMSKLQEEVGEYKMRVSTQEKMLAQKELQLLGLQEQCAAFGAQRDGRMGELEQMKAQHYNALKEAQEQVHRMKLKEEEIMTLKKTLQQQKDEAKKREEELNVEALEKVHKAVEQKRKEWEAEKVEALQEQCGILEEQQRKSLDNMRSDIQREKSTSQALERHAAELRTKVQEMEAEGCAQQREQETLLSVVCKSLKEEHQAELQRLQRHMEQQSQRAAQRLQEDVQLAVKESNRLRAALEERESSHNQITAELDQKLRVWVQQLAAECLHLHLLVEQSEANRSAADLPQSLTAAEALTTLKTLRGQLKHFIIHLRQELESQKQQNEELRKDKERELSIQRQQLRVQRDQALNSIKERLIQEHIEELSSLKWAHTRDGGAEGGRVAAFLRQQLRAKDEELRQVQSSMSQWKENTAARLACKFEEELTAELERCKAEVLRDRKASKTLDKRQRKPPSPEAEMIIGAKEAQTPLHSPSLRSLDSPASHGPSDVASFKLLRHLQSTVRRLRVENQTYTGSPTPPEIIPQDLSGSFVSKVPKVQQKAEHEPSNCE